MAVVEATVSMTAKMVKSANTPKAEKKNKDLQKTRLCTYFLQGKCGYGSNCQFAHTILEVRDVPDLKKTQLCSKFAAGTCTDMNCTYAHGEAELRERPNLKKKMCKWHSKGKCRNGSECGFAHSSKEVRVQAPPGLDAIKAPPGLNAIERLKKKFPAPPGLGDDVDCDASTDVPDNCLSDSQAETDLSSNGGTTSTMPDEHLFRFMAGHGAAPLKQQVALMGSAIGGLQEKLAQLEEAMLQTQVDQMHQQIQQLSAQCWALESGMCVTQQQVAESTPLKSHNRLNAKAAPFRPTMELAFG